MTSEARKQLARLAERTGRVRDDDVATMARLLIEDHEALEARVERLETALEQLAGRKG